MKTVIWKAKITEGKITDFEAIYNLFKTANGFISAEFYHLTEEENTMFVIESWESENAQTRFMGTMSQENMEKLFSLLDGRPDVWGCNIGAKILK